MTKKKWIILVSIFVIIFSLLWGFLYFHPYDSSWTRINKDGSCPDGGYIRNCFIPYDSSWTRINKD